MAPATATAPNLGTKHHDLEKMMTRDRDKLNHVRGTRDAGATLTLLTSPSSLSSACPIHMSDICCEHHIAQHGISRLAARPFSHVMLLQKIHRSQGTVCGTALQILDLHQPLQSDRGLWFCLMFLNTERCNSYSVSEMAQPPPGEQKAPIKVMSCLKGVINGPSPPQERRMDQPSVLNIKQSIFFTGDNSLSTPGF